MNSPQNTTTPAAQTTYSIVQKEPIAIVGMGCRFPGGSNNPEAFWNTLVSGRDCIVDVPEDRWDSKRFYDENRNKPGKMHVKSGGFLQEKIDEFDALFFGISPKEAKSLDPQQRVLMEVSWEALENAGIDPDTLSGSDTGVFIGGFMLDNKLGQLSPLNRDTISSSSAVGFTLTMLSNRISYFYDFRGPSMTIDTACSSSMVALDQACQNIWNGNCQTALVGGVNIMHRPEIFIAMSKGGFLAPDGRSKAFDERANGYGRGEGAGIVVIKPLSQAEKDKDNIYAVIRATGCNQDGNTDGITVPNPVSQRELIKKVTKQANIACKDIQYFEAHGTGTPVGDPIEMSAIGGEVGQAREADERCIVGSVKGAIGHLEAASGIAAVIKSALCLQHASVPPQANLINLNPKIPFNDLQIKIPRQVENLDSQAPIYSGINSFGYGGTNACAVLENYQKDSTSQNTLASNIQRSIYILPLSAKSKSALYELAGYYAQFIEAHPEISLADITFSSGEKKAQLQYRATVMADNREEMVLQLQEFAEKSSDSPTNDKIHEYQVHEPMKKVAFIFTGMGPQWWGMGRELMDSEPVFMASIKRCDEIFTKISGWSILEEMQKSEETSRVTDTNIAQTANFVLQVALVELWKSWGVEPSAVVGHSVGEVTSAYISGILSLEQALLVSFHRSRIQKKAANQGGMLAVSLTEAEALSIIKPYNGTVSIAAINAPTAITLAGDEKALSNIADELSAKDIFNRELKVEVAYHSPTMDPLLDEIRECLAELQPTAPEIKTYSTVKGDSLGEDSFEGVNYSDRPFGAEYWCHNVREPVFFFKALEQMIDDGFTEFLEIGPHPVLSTSVKECFAKNNIDGFLTSSLNRKMPEQTTIYRALSDLYGKGIKIKWGSVASTLYMKSDEDEFEGLIQPTFTRLPNYPWQRERYWNDASIALTDRIGTIAEFSALGHKKSGLKGTWETQVNSQFFAHLNDHKVEDLIILAGATYIEAALAANKATTRQDACLLHNIQLHNAMVLGADSETVMQTHFDEKTQQFTIQSHSIDETNASDSEASMLHATGKLTPLTFTHKHPVMLNEIKSCCDQLIHSKEIYSELDARGLQYGPLFQGIDSIWRRDNEVLALIKAPSPEAMISDAYQLHPSMLDACFQSLISALPRDMGVDDRVYIPVSIRQLRHFKKVPDTIYCHGVLTYVDTQSIKGDIILCDENGDVCVEICDLICQTLSHTQSQAVEDLDAWTYTPEWIKAENDEELEIADDCAGYIIINDGSAWARGLVDYFCVEKNTQALTVDCSSQQIRLNNEALQAMSIGEAIDSALITFSPLPHDKQVNVIYVCPQDDGDPLQLSSTHTFLALTQHLPSLSINTRLYGVTQNVTSIVEGDTAKGFTQSNIVGLARVASAELPSLRTTIIDCAFPMDKAGNSTSYRAILKECSNNSEELEVALRETGRYVYRLSHCSIDAEYSPDLEEWNGQDAVKRSTVTLDNSADSKDHKQANPEVVFEASYRREPQCDEVEIRILSVALDEWTDDEIARRQVCAEVVSVGNSVHDLENGDVIIACFNGNISNYVTLKRRALHALKKPETWDAIQSASSLTAFAIADTVLHQFDKSRFQPSFLILGSDTAVGQAASLLSNIMGIHTLGVTFDEESLLHISSAKLHDEIVEAANDRLNISRFDVILNVGAENVGVNFANIDVDQLLASHGKYITIASDAHSLDALERKAGTVTLGLTKSQLTLSPNSVLPVFDEKKTAKISDFCVDKREIEALLSRLQPLINHVEGEGLQSTIHSLTDLNHIDSSLSHQPHCASFATENTALVIPSKSVEFTVKPNVTYLITGGFGGFGLSMAEWLTQKGASHLALLSRSGDQSLNAKDAVEKLRALGATVYVGAVDVSDSQKLSDLMSDLKASFPPLAGVFHTAGVLDDKELLALDKDSMEKVIKPKALGAWNLHQQTLSENLDCFVLYSSISAVIGNRNQANYVAANVFLDNLAHYRQVQGLPAVSINWGALSGVGMAAENPSVIKHLENVGIRAFNSHQALEALFAVLQKPIPQVGIFDVDWARWKKVDAVGATSRFLSLESEEATTEGKDDWIAKITEQGKACVSCIADQLAFTVSQVLKLSIEQVDQDTPISNFGLDSLSAMDMQMKLRDEFEVDISILELMKGNSVSKLAEVIFNKLADKAQSGMAIEESGESNEKEIKVILPENDTADADANLQVLLDNLDSYTESELQSLLENTLMETSRLEGSGINNIPLENVKAS